VKPEIQHNQRLIHHDQSITHTTTTLHYTSRQLAGFYSAVFLQEIWQEFLTVAWATFPNTAKSFAIPQIDTQYNRVRFLGRVTLQMDFLYLVQHSKSRGQCSSVSKSVKLPSKSYELTSQCWRRGGEGFFLASHSLQFASVALDQRGINNKGLNQRIRSRSLSTTSVPLEHHPTPPW